MGDHNEKIKISVPEILKGYNYVEVKNDSSSDISWILNFFSNIDYRNFNKVLEIIPSEVMVTYLKSKWYHEVPSTDTGKKWNGGAIATYRWFVEDSLVIPEGEDIGDYVIAVLDDTNPHNKWFSHGRWVFINQMTQIEGRSEMDLILELLSLIPKKSND